ncbi:ABC transporter [Sphingomonas oleivorans]|uniref:ABC transporter n=2 Tax=Sphingomonas oleivorans TaxID=1735121 RepID=A0A2T5FXG9_9SPHN|nr:ABC transporter [Sphingomonas oleivorans]
MHQRRPLLSLLPILLGLPLAACISLGEKPPRTLLTLNAASPVAVGTSHSVQNGSVVAVLVPTVPQALMTQRVPVRTGNNSVAYLKDALWVEQPSRLFRALLAETIAARTGRIVPDLRLASFAPDTRLTGRLLNFGLDAPSSNVIVTYDAMLLRSGSSETRRFEARVPVADHDPETVATALNQAANQVAAEVSDWLGR